MLSFLKRFTKFALYSFFLTLCISVACFILFSCFFYLNQPITANMSSSVSIHSENDKTSSSGSGVVFINKNRTFVWTCKHVVDPSITEALHIELFKKQVKFQFEVDKVKVIGKLHNDDMDEAGYFYVNAKIIRFSTQDDLALLELCHTGIFKRSVSFPSNPKYTPKIGSKLFHIGSMGGLAGHHCVEEGIQGQPGVELQDVNMDRIAMHIRSGSSGGGAFEFWSGNCIGLVARAMNEKVSSQGYIVPWRKMHEFATRLDCVWALSNEPVPDNYLDNLTDDKLWINPNIIKMLQP